MSECVIKVENLSKQYRIGAREKYKTFRETLVDAAKAPLQGLSKVFNRRSAVGGRSSSDNTIWALNDVSFEVKQGEVLGIIGRNGAGKSTLLKILSKITEPTKGRIELRGRVGSLLEVGTGFHPELTGHENIYLYGAILGMDRWEITRKFDEIVAFAELEKSIDTPVKRYSSGMYMRLAFAVAAHLEPEILLVDEVLAVGDAAFQAKCLGKMGEVSDGGRTVLFVSHNMGAITRLCKRSVWLDEGGVAFDGPSNRAVGRYQSQYLTACAEWKTPNSLNEDGDFSFLIVGVKTEGGKTSSLFAGDECVTVAIRYLVRRPLSGCQIACRVYNSDGLVVFSTADADTSRCSALPKEPGEYSAVFTIPAGFLAPGTYWLLVAGQLPYRCTYEIIQQAAVFEISPSGSLASLDGRLGVVTPLIHWKVHKEMV